MEKQGTGKELVSKLILVIDFSLRKEG